MPSEDRADHIRGSGWYSHSVLARVLDNTVPPRLKLSLQRLQLHDHERFIHDGGISGALISEENQHWTALVKHVDAAWYVDSCARPKRLNDDEFIGCVTLYPDTYIIVTHDYGG